MTNHATDAPGAQALSEPPGGRPSAGAQLRAAREAAQITLDDVAQQLKLARRQVLAIENDDLAALPGPTFVRGFIRNYARLLRIDPAPLLEASLPAATTTSPIQQLAPTMGELPLETGTEIAWARWLIPCGLILVLVAGIAYYEFADAPTMGKKARKETAEVAVAPPIVTPEPAARPAGPPPADTPAPAEPVPAVPEQAVTFPAPMPQAIRSDQSAATVTGRVDLEFTGPSWVEVRDARGEILISRTLSAQDSQSLTGALPLTLRIGNASVARLTFDGKRVDLAPHTRSEIARLTLPLQRP